MNVCLPARALLIAAVMAVTGCVVPPGHHFPGRAYNLPPAQRLMEPGPGVGGPGPGVIPPATPPAGPPSMGPAGPSGPATVVQVLFVKPESMQIQWDTGGMGQFDSVPLVAPGRQNFPEGGIYRLKLTNIPERVGVELYPTIEIGPTTPRSGAFLAHNAIPVQFTKEDFDQVLTGNFVTKVIYLPDPEFQEMAMAGVDTLVSTRLDPHEDPIVEADRRGAILAIVRLGNKDIEMPGDGFQEGMVMPVAYTSSTRGAPPMPGQRYGAMPAAGYYGGPAGAPIGYAPEGLGPVGNAGPAAMAPFPVGSGVAPNYVAGVTAPNWGMPYSGTPIGLPGPPHIPLGAPAGFQRQDIHNHTQMHIPGPTRRMHVHVQQRPGFSYPPPPNRVFIQESTIHPALNYHQPLGDAFRKPTH